MSDELDTTLLRLFEQRREPLGDLEFLTALLKRIEGRQRAAALRQGAVVVAAALLAAWMLPGVLRTTALAVQSVRENLDDYAPLVLSPWGWALSMLVGLGVILRMTPLRR